MTIIQRVSKLVTANVHQLLDKAEDPEVMVRQIIRDMEESIIELRRETHKAVSQQKLLEKKIELCQRRQEELEKQAGQALEHGNETLARDLLAKKLDQETRCGRLQDEHREAIKLTEQMKESLASLEDQVQTARRKKEEIIRRKHLARAKLTVQQHLHPSTEGAEQVFARAEEHLTDLERYQEKVLEMEAEAEALESLSQSQPDPEKKLETELREKAVQEALQKLKKKQKGRKP